MSEILLLFESFVVVGGRTLLHGTALALVTWLICATLLRKARPALHAALWTVVLFKFLVPPILPGEMALSGLMGSLVRGSLGVGTASSLLVLPAGTGSAGASAGMVTPLAVVESVSWTTMLLAGYLAALLLVAGTALLKTMRTFAELRRLPLAGSELNALVAQLAARLGLRRPPRIRVTDRTVSPYVIGLTRPTLVVPSRLLEQIEPAAREALLVHELAHLRRGDLLVRLAQNTARIVFFFWPPVWWVCTRVEGFTEMVCDQWAVSVSSVQPHLYARSLLEVVRTIGDSPRASQELAFAYRGKILEERFRMILKRSKSSSPRLSWLMIPALVVWVSFALGGGAARLVEQEEGEVVKKRVKRVEVIIAGEETDKTELLARVVEEIPEADLDGDGELTVDELKEFSAAQGEEGRHVFIRLETDGSEPIVIGSPDERDIRRIMVRRWHGATSESDETMEIHAEAFSGEEGVQEMHRMILERHPEIDLDGDGELSREEMAAHLYEFAGPGRYAFIGEESGVHKSEDHVAIEAHVDTGEEGHDVRKRLIFDVMITSERTADILEHHPEVDVDGDGEASPEEVRQFFSERGESVFIEKKRLALHAGEGEETDYSWATEDGRTVRLKVRGFQSDMDTDGDGHISESEARAFFREHSEGRVEGHRVRIHEKHHAADSDGDGEVSEGEMLQYRESLSEKRRQSFLKKHPDADLDGDGQISKDAAEALARQLQSKKQDQ